MAERYTGFARVWRMARSMSVARGFGRHKQLTVAVLSAVLAIYTVGEVFLAFRHEPWRDESQAWLIARDATLADLFGGLLSDEGHPALWYLLLMPFAKLGAPYQTMVVISMIVMLTAMVTLYVADIPLWIKLVVPFTPLAVYNLPVMSRSYCLMALFCALIIAGYPNRLRHPWTFAVLVALLFQIHVWMFGFAGMLFLLFAGDLRRSHHALWPLLLPVASMALAAFELFPRRSDESYVQLHLPTNGLTDFGKIFLLILLCAWLAGRRCGLMVCASYGWVLLVVNILYPFYGPQKMSAFLWLMLACALLAERDAIEWRMFVGLHIRKIPEPSALERARGALCVAMTLVLVLAMAQWLASPWYWSSIRLDARSTVSLGSSLAQVIDKARIESPNATVVPLPDSGSIYASSNALPYLPRETRLWNSMTKRNMTYADDDFRMAMTAEIPLGQDIVKRSLVSIRQAGASEAIVVGCGAYDEITISNQFTDDSRFRHIGIAASPDATKDQTIFHGSGFRCDVYLYEG